jgi:hypothetical protein
MRACRNHDLKGLGEGTARQMVERIIIRISRITTCNINAYDAGQQITKATICGSMLSKEIILTKT